MTPIPTIVHALTTTLSPTLTPTSTITPTISMIPTPQASPTLDTLIGSLTLFSNILLGSLTLFLGVIAAIGGFLVWNGFEMRRKAEKDLQKIEDTKNDAVKTYVDLQAVSVKLQEFTDKVIKVANEKVRGLAELVEQAGQSVRETKESAIAVKKAKDVLNDWENKYSAYSDVSKGTAAIYEAPTPYPPAQGAFVASAGTVSLRTLLEKAAETFDVKPHDSVKVQEASKVEIETPKKG